MQEDRALLAAAAHIARQFDGPRPVVYWIDLLVSAAVGYGAFYAMTVEGFGLPGALLFVLCVLALYRAESFIHELTHIPFQRMPGFYVLWNLVVGIPLMTPAFLYEGVHNQHHLRAAYGTARDPEYMPMTGGQWGSVIGFVAIAALAPVGLLLRFGVLAPLSAVIPPLRRIVVRRASALATNPSYERAAPTGPLRRRWLVLEVLTTIWALALFAMLAKGVLDWRVFALGVAVMSALALVNQVRTLAAHLWQNHDGQEMSLTDQFLDSVNVPPPGLLPELWAPVGLRYHALHHLLPSLAYHDLGKAHRMLVAHFADGGTYGRSNYPRLTAALNVWIGRKA